MDARWPTDAPGVEPSRLAQRANREAAQTGDQETLQALIDADDQPVYAVDRELRYTAFNRAHADVMRSLYRAEIAVGGCLTDYQSVAADRRTAAADLTRALAGEQVTGSVLTGEGPQQRLFEVAHAPQRDDAGQIVGVLVRARDVTGRRHTELEAILDATADGILAVDQSRRVILTNRRFAEMWRIPDELVQAGEETALLHYVADQLARPEEFLGKVEELMRSDATVFDTLFFKDGRVFERHSAPIMRGSDLTGRVWSFSDMTASENARTELQERTEELDALLSVSRALASSIDYDEVLAHVASAAANALGCPCCDIWEYVPGDEVLVCRHLWERAPRPGLAEATVGSIYEVAQHTGGVDALHRSELVLDQRSDPALSELDGQLMDAWGEKTWLTVPLVSKRGLLGVMTLSETERERRFTGQERRLVAAVAEQAAVALENALLVRQQETHMRWLRALVAASREAASRLEMAELLTDIARYAAESVGAPLAYVYEFDSRRDVLITRSWFGSSKAGRHEPPGSESPVAESPGDRAILAGDQVVVETISDSRLPDQYRRLMREWGEKTLVNVPFRYGGEPFGLLVLIETATERRYTADELDYLRAFGEQAAMAIHNARLYEEARQARHDLAALNAELEQHVEERTRDLRAANAELEAFAYSVSHDLRAPLRAIDGFSHILLEDEGDALSDTGHEHLGRVRASAQRMGELIDALLALSRLARSEINLAPVDLSAAAEKVLARLSEGDPDRRVAHAVEPGCTAVSDASLLEAVLTNLLGNAWKFTRGRAEAHIEFGCRTGDDETVYFVRDDGAGFDAAYVDKLFQPFQRLHTDEQFAGTGIGLATVRRIIGRLGGRCWAEGTPGAGATFYFTLPT